MRGNTGAKGFRYRASLREGDVAEKNRVKQHKLNTLKRTLLKDTMYFDKKKDALDNLYKIKVHAFINKWKRW
jgi:hypothetical protein